MQTRDISWLTQTPIAHRGLYNNERHFPENGVKAFQAAIDKGYAIEMDVFVMENDTAIVFHDEDLVRMCRSEKMSASLCLKDLEDSKLYPIGGTKEGIPLLKDVLSLVAGRVPLLIDIKNYSKNKKANLLILNTLLGYRGHVAVQSYDPSILAWFRKYAPTIPRGQVMSDLKKIRIGGIIKFLLRNMLLDPLTKPDFIACAINDLTNNKILKARKKGTPILAWTVDSKERYESVKIHCDNIIFEHFFPRTR